ncbi:hypothetical protein KSP40_PGU019862 [Platanthera guangdongensis]|uniref:Uncharacterized protein n=1 Tax=Platanthera guangdongensis TaxID=2320717 RepID=A0ABR2MCS5_9ASPA
MAAINFPHPKSVITRLRNSTNTTQQIIKADGKIGSEVPLGAKGIDSSRRCNGSKKKHQAPSRLI